MKIKICGITREIDATGAASSGADAIGLNFWPGSKRCVSVAKARKIVRELPAMVWAVGVFVNARREEIEDAIARAGLNAIQLHGDEKAGDARGYSVPVLKAVHVGAKAGRITFKGPLVLDAHQPGYGGGGLTFDWSRAAKLARQHQVFLAGGLTPQNVGRAIDQVRPYGVDAASGVELAPGIKSAKLVAAFISEARQAFERVRP